MTEREQLEQAIAALEEKRDVLGSAVIEEALAPLRARLAMLDAAPTSGSPSAVQPDASPARERAVSPADERRVISILFCDVKGSTAMAERLDPEEWAAIIKPALEYLTSPVRRHGGTVAEVRGDGILAFFGAPAAHEDDPQRSVIAGLEILESIQVFREKIKSQRGLDFNVRVGIHTGLVVVTSTGAEGQIEFTAVGEAMNLAARMEQTAQPGTLQISHQTYRLVEGMFACESLGEIKVKGKHKPVRAYRVVGLKEKPRPPRGLESHGLRSPLVGRAAELAVLRGCIQRLLSGQGGVVAILAEAGIGKSRLLAEIRGEVSSELLYWLEGSTLSFGQTISYWPFQEILRRFAGISDQDGENVAWRKLESGIAALFPQDSGEILPFLASLLALPVKGEYAGRVEHLDGDALGKGIFVAARRFFERLAGARPVALVFEDLHWMDESSAGLLEHLLPLCASVPLLVVFLSRPYRKTPAARLADAIAKDHAAHYTEIQLAPLSPPDSRQLVHNLLEEDLSGEVRQMILSRAEGNPFFLEEILRALIDLGSLQRDASSGHWRAAQIESLAIPNTVGGVILARLDRLEEGVKEVLRVAAVIGRSFLYRVLQAVDEAEERLDERLAELVHIELIQEKQRFPELEYFYKHALAQEAVYESILLQKRRALHARVGEALELIFADRLEEFYGLLAHHYARAEAWEKAQDYLLKVADQAGRMAADAEALAHYRQALAAYALAFGERWDPIQRADLERKIGEALFRRGEHVQAIDHMRRALAYLGSPLPASLRSVRLAILLELTRHIGYRLRARFFPPVPAKSFNEAIEAEARTYESLVWIAGVNPEDLFLIVALRMLNFSEKNGFLPGAIIGFATLGLIADFMALPPLAQYYGQKAVDLAGQSQHPGALSSAYTFRAIHENIHCRWDAVMEYAQRAIDVQRQSGYWNTRVWGLSVMSLADAHIHQGEFAEALARSQELVRFGRDSADRQALCWGLARQGYAQHGLGQLAESAGSLIAAMDSARSIPDYQTYVDSGGELGKCYLHQGRLEEAFAVFAECQQLSLEHNLKKSPVITRFINGLAEACLLAAEQGIEAEKDSSLKKAGQACREALKQGKAYAPGMPEAMMLQGRYEWLRGDPQAAKKWWQRSLLLAEQIGVCYDLGRTHFEMGQRLGESSHLEKAGAIFAQIGAELYMERTSKLARSEIPGLVG